MSADGGFLASLRGKELHFRLTVNDLLEDGKTSLIAVSRGGGEAEIVGDAILKSRRYREYSPQSILSALVATASGRRARAKPDPAVVVLVEERDGSVSADDHRYIEWLSETRGEVPRVVLVPERGRRPGAEGAGPDSSNEGAGRPGGSFWSRQYRRLKALPAPITRDAALVAIPRTVIPVAFSVLLAFLKRAEIPLERSAAYVGLAFGFNVAFGLFSQTVFNWFTFWSEFSRDAFGPAVRALSARAAGRGRAVRALAGALSFVSARGDVLIAAPLLGIGTMYLARLALGPVGETVSVLTWRGFLLVLGNVIVGSIAGGPYPQMVAHLRAVGKITNKASIYLGIIETVKMEIGRIADFGMQVLYNAIQGTLAAVFWILLLVVDRCYAKPIVEPIRDARDAAVARRLFDALRARGASASAQAV